KSAEAEKDLLQSVSLARYEPARRLLAQLRSGVGTAPARNAPAVSPAPIQFRDVAESAGLRFVLENNPTPQKHLIETMAGGVAAFDYNNDGLPDIYFTNGASIPSLSKDAPRYWNRLYRNDGGMKFADVTEEAGVAGAGYSMGVAAADYDNDGYVDLFVAGVRHNILYHNAGHGQFQDVTARAGIKSDGWSVAAGWFDYDNDGLLDLFVVNYVEWSPSPDPACRDPTGTLRRYCHPSAYWAASNRRHHNRGHGTVERGSERAGRSGWCVGLVDLNNDGWKDVFSANSHVTDNIEKFSVDRYQQPNSVFVNLGNGTFEDVSAAAGPDFQTPRAHRGAAFADFNH